MAFNSSWSLAISFSFPSKSLARSLEISKAWDRAAFSSKTSSNCFWSSAISVVLVCCNSSNSTLVFSSSALASSNEETSSWILTSATALAWASLSASS